VIKALGKVEDIKVTSDVWSTFAICGEDFAEREVKGPPPPPSPKKTA